MTDSIDRLKAALADRYAIQEELGAGGMATVYLAEDLKHHRKVAVKVLRPELAAILGAERFLKEIEVTANLQHPHILPLHDSGEADSFLYYVMPYVEGESLRDKLNRDKQLGVEETVEIAKGVAAALDYAHRQGLIHRDIKPENILLHDGQPVVADFGIALAVTAAGGTRLTGTGLSLGTPQYMSPEQATGERELTARSDVYSLGAVVYEMLTGDPPHTGNTVQAINAKVVSVEPQPISDVRHTAPRNIDAAVQKALAKVPADRFVRATEFAEALRNPAFALPAAYSGAALTAPAPTPYRYLWPAIALLSVTVAVWGWLRPAEHSPVARLHISLPDDHRLAFGGGAYPIDISRDGSKLVYLGERSGGTQLYLRNIDDFSTRVLPGTEGARQPFFSPDGEWVGFHASGELQRVSVSGGAPIAIADLPPGRTRGASWGTDGTILYSAGGMVHRVAAAGGDPSVVQMIPTFEETEGRDDAAPITGDNPLWPHFLPDAEHALITVRAGTGVLDLKTGELRYLFSGSQAKYLPTGHLIFNAGQERVRAIPFDLSRLEITGSAAPALENVFRGRGGGAVNFAVSETGTLIYISESFERSLVLVDRNGRETPVPVEPRGYRFPRISLDRRWIAVTVDPRPSDLWIVDLQRGGATRQPTPEDHDGWGVWAPDGKRVAYVRSNRDPRFAWRAFPLSGDPTLIVGEGHAATFPTTWTPDDRLLAHRNAVETKGDIVAIGVADGVVHELVATEANEYDPRLSPDGQWLAYVSDASGVNEVYVVAYPDPAESNQISVGGGVDPNWSADGSELFHRSGNTIMAVDVDGSVGSFVPSAPVNLFSGQYDFSQDGNWAVGPDQQFVMIKSDPTTSRQFQVVLNWFEELR